MTTTRKRTGERLADHQTVAASRIARRRSDCEMARKTRDLPLAVWLCAQKTSQWQRHRRYLPESNRHPGKMLPALARQAILSYSDPGDLVVDPMCGIGTTLVEAIHAGRNAAGIELEQRWAALATANIEHARSQGAAGAAQVIRGNARKLPTLLSTRAQPLLKGGRDTSILASGGVDLVLTSPPYACQVADLATENLKSGDGPLRREETTNYSPDRRNLGHARGDTYLAAMASVYEACAAVLKPGGFLVLVTKDTRCKGALRNLSGQTIALCEQAGLAYWQRAIALLATIRDEQLQMRPSFWQTMHVRRARARGERTQVVAHEDVLVFRKRPQAATLSKPDTARRTAPRDQPRAA
jgi:modification methylase